MGKDNASQKVILIVQPFQTVVELQVMVSRLIMLIFLLLYLGVIFHIVNAACVVGVDIPHKRTFAF